MSRLVHSVGLAAVLAGIVLTSTATQVRAGAGTAPGPVPPAVAAAGESAAWAEAQCLRDHGLELSNVTVTSTYSVFVFAPGFNPSRPGFEAAEAACGEPTLPPR